MSDPVMDLIAMAAEASEARVKLEASEAGAAALRQTLLTLQGGQEAWREHFTTHLRGQRVNASFADLVMDVQRIASDALRATSAGTAFLHRLDLAEAACDVLREPLIRYVDENRPSSCMIDVSQEGDGQESELICLCGEAAPTAAEIEHAGECLWAVAEGALRCTGGVRECSGQKPGTPLLARLEKAEAEVKRLGIEWDRWNDLHAEQQTRRMDAEKRIAELEAGNARLRAASIQFGILHGGDHHSDDCPAPGGCASCGLDMALAEGAGKASLEDVRLILHGLSTLKATFSEELGTWRTAQDLEVDQAVQRVRAWVCVECGV